MSATLPMDTVPDRPDLLVEVAGAAVDPLTRDDVVAVEVHEEVGRHGRATLLVRNWDDDAGAVTHSETGPFVAGAAIRVHLGYRDELEPVFDGVVTGMRARFVPDAQPVLEVQCRTRGVLLAGRQRTRAFDDISDGRVAESLAGDHGLRASTEDGPTHEHLVQFAESDWDLLTRRARVLGFVLYVRGDELIFRPADRSAEAVISLQWGASLLEVDLHQDLGRPASAVTALAWDPDNLERVEAEADPDGAAFAAGDRPKPAAAQAGARWPSRGTTLAHSGPLGSDEVIARADGEADRQALAHISGRGRCLGVPALRSDAWVELLGVGQRVAGAHYVTATRHTLGSDGYFTEFQVGLPAALGPAASAGDRRLAGLYTAVVEDLDDPRGWGRVKVSLPWAADEPLVLWARLALPAAGPDQGFFFIPDPGHEVVVAFCDGDPRFPVVVGSMWNGRHAPPLEVDAGENGMRGLVSRSGHRLLLDDTGGAESVRIETQGGHTLVLDDAEGLVGLHEQGGNGITLDSGGITIEAVQGDVTVKSAAGKVQLSGSSGLDASSQGPMRLESTATLDVQASAVLGITGALVKINS